MDRLACIIYLGKFNQSLSKADMAPFMLYLIKHSVNSNRDTIPFEPSFAAKDSQ